ncbi:MAG: NADH-quinone oxidoreductase subunit M [Dehalococcoidia bacterium]|nr:NADH-quinone oxidoreductase subunit M [Dehalococcoidia bacterium]
MEKYLLLALIGLPLATSIVLVAVPSRYPNVVRYISAVSGFALFGLSLYLFFAYELDNGEAFQFQLRWPWLENVGFLGEDGITFHLGLDGIGAPMVLLNGIVAFTGVLVSWKIDHRNKDFFVLLFALIAGVFGTFTSLDLFFFFFFYELAVLPMFLLIAVWGSSSRFPTFVRTKEYGAMKLTLYLVAASILIFIGIFAVFIEADRGTFDLPTLYQVQFSEDFQKIVFPVFLVGCGVLAGLWPFHTWSPDGHVAAPTAVSMLHAGVLMKLGAFGIIRLGIQLLPEGAEFWMPGLMILATTNVIYGAVSAMAQRDFKYMVGYSSVSHMGYVLMGLATLNSIGMNGAVLQMFSHGIMTALMFAMVGAIYDQAHVRDMSIFGGLANQMPRFAAFFAIAGLASLGLPGLSGFVAEFHIFVGTFQTYPAFGALAIFGAAITAAYILRMLAMAFFGPFNERWSHLTEMTRWEQAAGAVLIFFLLFMGLWPAPFIDRISDSVLTLAAIR